MAELEKPLLNDLWHAASKQKEAVLNCFFVSRIPFHVLSGFMWILVSHVSTPICCMKQFVCFWLFSPEITTQKLYSLNHCLVH